MRVIVFGLVLLLTSGCQNILTFPYNMVIATDNGFYVDNTQRFSKRHLNRGKEDGEWTFSFKSIDYSSGQWKDGLKIDKWKYDLGHKKVEITYNTFFDSLTNFRISYPDFWASPGNSLENSLFMMGDSTQSTIDENKFFVVMAFNKKQIGHDLDSFNKYYNDRIETKSYSKTDNWIIWSTDRKYFLNRYIVKQNEEEILLLNLNLETEDTIYEISYKTLNRDTKEDFMKFFEVALTASHNDFRLFNPFDKIKTVDKIGDEATAPNNVYVSLRGAE